MPRREDPNKETLDRLSKKTNLNILNLGHLMKNNLKK